ncbi:MAG: glycosyltransferase [Microgenomates group bacterium]
MKILFITATYVPSANGVAISIKNLKENLKANGHNVLVLAPENRNADTKEAGVLYYHSMENPVFGDYPIPLFILTKKIINEVSRFNPDIIHVHHPFHIGYSASVIAKKLSKPLVFTYHTQYDYYAEKYFDFLPKELKPKFVFNSLTNFCNTTNLVISPSKFIAEELVEKGVDNNISVIPSVPTDLHKSQKSKAELRVKHGIDINKRVLLSVSRLATEKNLEKLIHSLKYLPSNYLLVICGGGPIENNIKMLIQRLNLQSKVILTGSLNRYNLSEYYSLADYFYYASYSETQGMVFLEALTFGLPVIATNSKAAKEWIGQDFGILASNNPEEIAKAVSKIELKDYDSLSKNSKIFSEKFTSKKAIQKLITEYKKTIKSYGLSNAILKTGWQSWSVRAGKSLFNLKRDYNPLPNEYIAIGGSETKVNKKPIKGWCSWYAFGRNINHNKILNQANWFKDNAKKVLIDYVLIDEGWTRWGDWDKTIDIKFPFGMKKTSRDIHNYGLKSGIWIAPFLIEEDSELYKKHPDWIVTKDGIPINGINWTLFDDLYFKRYVLDIRKKEAQSFIFKTIDLLINSYGFDLIKLDFLYSIYFIPNITAGEAGGFIRKLMSYIKNNYPDVYIIACGSPLVPLVGVADSVRIGPDTISPMLDGIPLVSTIYHSLRVRDVIDNIKKRQFTNKYWNVDPDVFVCRKSLGLSDTLINELQQTIVRCKGNLLLGDDMTQVSKDRIDKYIFPLFKNA